MLISIFLFCFLSTLPSLYSDFKHLLGLLLCDELKKAAKIVKMASVNLAGKRRRAENAASTLSKPFKSPLRRPMQSNATTTPKKEEGEEGNRDSLETLPQRSTTEEKNEKHTTPTSSTTSSHPTISQTRKRKTIDTSTTPTKKKTWLSSADPVVADLQKQQRALQSRLASLQSDLDTAQQALRIESSNRHTELKALIAKWRGVSQDAAEEVFAGAQERVTRMGGMAAWKEQKKSRDARWEEEEMESWFGSPEVEGNDLDENELVLQKEEMMHRLGEIKKENGAGSKEEEKIEENEVGSSILLIPGCPANDSPGVHYGYDAQDTECRPPDNRI